MAWIKSELRAEWDSSLRDGQAGWKDLSMGLCNASQAWKRESFGAKSMQYSGITAGRLRLATGMVCLPPVTDLAQLASLNIHSLTALRGNRQ
jgi:hypothetical protein